MLECGPDKKCYPDTCCSVREKGEKNGDLTDITSHSPQRDGEIRHRSNGGGNGGTAAASITISRQNSDNSENKDVPATAI